MVCLAQREQTMSYEITFTYKDASATLRELSTGGYEVTTYGDGRELHTIRDYQYIALAISALHRFLRRFPDSFDWQISIQL